jgi:hypothetical protein
VFLPLWRRLKIGALWLQANKHGNLQGIALKMTD